MALAAAIVLLAMPQRAGAARYYPGQHADGKKLRDVQLHLNMHGSATARGKLCVRSPTQTSHFYPILCMTGVKGGDSQLGSRL